MRYLIADNIWPLHVVHDIGLILQCRTWHGINPSTPHKTHYQSFDVAHNIHALGRVRHNPTKNLQSDVVSSWYVTSTVSFPINDSPRMSYLAQQLNITAVTFIVLDIPIHVEFGLVLHYDTVNPCRLRFIYSYNFLMKSTVLIPMCSACMSSLAQRQLDWPRHVVCYAPIQTWILLRVVTLDMPC